MEEGEKGLIAILCDFLIQPHGVLFPPNTTPVVVIGKKITDIFLFS